MHIYSQGSLQAKKGYICIPAYNEKPFLELINQLHRQLDKHAVLIFINAPENSSEDVIIRNEQCFESLKNHMKGLEINGLILMDNSIPSKKAGVGYARKTIMDKAAEFCKSADQTWISGLDADCLIETNYISSIDTFFETNSTIQGASIRFRHPIIGPSIEYYESHLRYLKLSLQWARYPFYYHTVGSSMVVRASIYSKIGGMNKKKAGEDFYFLQKVMPHGYGEINETCVFPSPRISDRVPFGTGRAMGSMKHKNERIQPYPIESFHSLKTLMNHVNFMYKTPLGTAFSWPKNIEPNTKTYFEEKGFPSSWNSISKNSKTLESRNKKFLDQLSGNTVILFLNQERSRLASKRELKVEIENLFGLYKKNVPKNSNYLEELCQLELENSFSFLPKFST